MFKCNEVSVGEIGFLETLHLKVLLNLLCILITTNSHIDHAIPSALKKYKRVIDHHYILITCSLTASINK